MADFNVNLRSSDRITEDFHSLAISPRISLLFTFLNVLCTFSLCPVSTGIANLSFLDDWQTI